MTQQFPQQPQGPWQQQPYQPPKKPTSPWVWIGLMVVVAVVIALVVGLLTRGSNTASSTTAAPAVTTTSAATTRASVGTVSDPSDFTGPDRAFLATLTNAAVKAGNSSVDLVNLGRKICPRISASGKEKAMSILTDAGFSILQATDVMYAAVVAYCPDQLTGVR